MYLNCVIDYKNAWNFLNEEYPEVLVDIQKCLDELDIHTMFDGWWNRKHEKANVLMPSFSSDILRKIQLNLNKVGWQGISSRHKEERLPKLQRLGSRKKDVSVKALTASGEVLPWIYNYSALGIKVIDIKIPILILFNESRVIAEHFFNIEDTKVFFKDYEAFTLFEDLQFVEPLTVDHNFLIIGVGFVDNGIKILPLKSENEADKIKVNHCITFEPEYHQAGLGILSYFGTVLREKYPEQNATVKIEQQDLTVRMIVESENGNKEVIEKALHEYELVISGQTPIEDFYPTAIQTLELKNKIRMLNYELETQREISALKDGMILDLRALAHQALSQPQPNITVINQLHNEQNIKIDYKSEINQSYEALDELIDLLSDESIKNQLRDIQNALDNTRERQTPEEIQESSGFKKLGKFLRQAKDASSNIHGILENTDNAVGVIENLTKHYEKLVQFCQSFIS